MIAGEQQTFAFKEETKVIAGMTRRVHCGERELIGRELVAITKSLVSLEAIAITPRHHLCTGRSLQCRNARRVVRMCMGTDDPTDTTFGRLENRRRVCCIFRTGIDDDNLVVSNEIRVGSRAGHMARIVRRDTTNQRRNYLRHFMNQRRYRGEGVSHSLAQARSTR